MHNEYYFRFDDNKTKYTHLHIIIREIVELKTHSSIYSMKVIERIYLILDRIYLKIRYVQCFQ